LIIPEYMPLLECKTCARAGGDSDIPNSAKSHCNERTDILDTCRNLNMFRAAPLTVGQINGNVARPATQI
jgi:hypothetical protein